MDELPEFNRQALEALREPLEAGHICLARAHQQVTFPASFQLVAAMNPCPCGYAGMSNNRCRCTPERIQHYLTRISGPLLDRIDIRLSLQPVELDQLQQGHHGETSVVVAARVQGSLGAALQQRVRPPDVERHPRGAGVHEVGDAGVEVAQPLRLVGGVRLQDLDQRQGARRGG